MRLCTVHHSVALIECDWKVILNVTGKFICQPMLLSVWHEQLELIARTNIMPDAVNGPPGAEQIGVVTGARIHQRAALVIICQDFFFPHQIQRS